MQSPYDILGVSQEASTIEIKKAYRALAKEWHPDKHQGKETYAQAEIKFKEISEAYNVLSNPQKRKQLDFESRHAFNWDIFSVFQKAAGANKCGKNHAQSYPGQNVEIVVQLSLLEAILGVEKEVHYQVKSACNSCNGEGGTEIIPCPQCTGTGFERITMGAGVTMGQTCRKCHGYGKYPSIECDICNATGWALESKTPIVNFPPGIKAGSRMRLRAAGGKGKHGGVTGDAFLKIDVKYPDLTKITEEEKEILFKMLA